MAKIVIIGAGAVVVELALMLVPKMLAPKHLVPKLQLGNLVLEALASSLAKLELRKWVPKLQLGNQHIP